jgi:hypothetical protein
LCLLQGNAGLVFCAVHLVQRSSRSGFPVSALKVICTDFHDSLAADRPLMLKVEV